MVAGRRRPLRQPRTRSSAHSYCSGSAAPPPRSLGDHAARLAPLTDNDVFDLITALRSAQLLFGAHGSGPVDLEGLEQLLLRLSRPAATCRSSPRSTSTPVLATAEGVSVLDAPVRLVPRRPHDPCLRRLR
ncbi:acetate--CoA ligase family protein [Streptomyces yanii]|uniref:acetate--CoA ligase family protein n=1 Tax=Streptomyces yanii TaxID=78510 RepID=UPI003CD0868C